MAAEDSKGSLFKIVPITAIIASAAYGVTFVWFLAGLKSDLENNKLIYETNRKEIVNLYGKVSQLEKEYVQNAILLARIEENLKSLKELLEDRQDGRNPN